MHTTLDPITYKGCVYPWQCDQIGHMNIMWYVGKFDEANWNHLARVGITPSYLRTEERGMEVALQPMFKASGLTLDREGRIVAAEGLSSCVARSTIERTNF